MNALKNPRTRFELAVGLAALVVLAAGPAFINGFWINGILTQAFIMGIAAASLIFLFAYGGMISLAQTALLGICGYIYGNLVSHGGAGGQSKGLALGWDPSAVFFVAIAITVAIGLVLGAVAARSLGIYFLMLTLTYSVIAYYFFSQVVQFGGFSPIAGISQYTPSFVGSIGVHDQTKLYYITLGAALGVYLLIKYVARTPFGITLQGIRDDPVRMSSLGYNVALHRTLAFGFGAFIAALAGVLFVWWNGEIAPGDVYLSSTINLLVMAVIGGMVRIEGAFVGALAFLAADNEITNTIPSSGLPAIGGTFNTIIGVFFLLIVVISPDGLMGIWNRLLNVVFGRQGGPAAPTLVAPPGEQPEVAAPGA